MLVITKGAYPVLYSLLEAISYDNGMVNRDHPLPDAFEVPARFNLRDLEYAAEDLDGPDRVLLCVGEDQEQATIYRRSLSLTRLHQMLDAWFDGDTDV